MNVEFVSYVWLYTGTDYKWELLNRHIKGTLYPVTGALTWATVSFQEYENSHDMRI